MEFTISKLKKSLDIAELLVDLPQTDEEVVAMDPLLVKSFFLISTSETLCGDILTYLQTQCFRPEIYPIINDTLYRFSVETVLR